MKNNNNTNPFIKKPNKTLQTSETKTERESTTKGLSYIAKGKHFHIAFNI